MPGSAARPHLRPWPLRRSTAPGAGGGVRMRDAWRGVPMAAAHLTVLWAFAIVKPLFDELATNAEFFVARDNTSTDIVVFAVALTVVPPVVLAAVELLAGLAWPRVGRGLHVVFVGILAAAVAMGVLKRLEPDESALLIPAAAGIGAAMAAAYARTATARRFLTVLTPAPALFLVIFLLLSPVSELVVKHEAAAAASVARTDTPVVLVVFDELPTISLMDANGQVDAAGYPNFGRLAASSTWYRNATTVADGTFVAVPAILAGKWPDRRLPTSHQYPRSVFTLLAPSHDVAALEPITQVCPTAICGARPAKPAPTRLRSLVRDLSVVGGHLLLPSDLAAGLSPIDRDYEDFAGAERGVQAPPTRAAPRRQTPGEPPIAGSDVFAQRLRDAEQFVRNVAPQGARPPLYVAHLEVPHVPWRLLPSGHQYPVGGPNLPGLADQTWTRKAHVVEQATQRHLLQVGYADRLLGRLVQRLQEVGLWDGALVIVTADHGVGLRPGGSRRPVTRADFAAIAGVPLFVKLPEQTSAVVDDSPARTIDILPTIADVVGVAGDAGDGAPLTRTQPTAAPSVRNGRRAKFVGVGPVDAFVRARDAELARQRALFPRGLLSAFEIGPNPALLGRRLGELRVRSGAQRAEVEGAAAFAGVRRSTGVLPVYVSGRLRGGVPDGQALAVAVNGRIRAVGRSYLQKGRHRFSMLIPPSSLRTGRNVVEVLAVRAADRVIRLARVG